MSVKPYRQLRQITLQPRDKAVKLYKMNDLNVIWGSDSNANFIDVVSVGPISNISNIYVNEVNTKKGEFPSSIFNVQTGAHATSPWNGDFPFVERTESLNKTAEIKDVKSYTKTEFTRAVSSKGVEAVRINFTTGGFTHRDNKNRRKIARAYFKLSLLDSRGQVVKTVNTFGGSDHMYWAQNPTSVQLTIQVGSDYKEKIWSYKVEMYVMGQYYGTSVNGNWTASTVTELYRDTQTYKDIAYCSGKIVAAEVAAKTPKRQYLVSGYQVAVPKFNTVNGKDVFLGTFDKKTSDSFAWNAMAVLTDTKWGAGLPVDKINLPSFLAFDRYCKESIKGKQRYSHSQYLIKEDNYFKLAQQIVGAADGKLYEDTSGRIGILIDRKTDKRRIITSYDLKDERVKRTTVPETKKINYVQGEFDDKANLYKKTIINVKDQAAINVHGVVSKKLKLDTCTSAEEANRMLNKVLVTSQVASSSYTFTVGYNHEDIQIGEVVALYDRLYSRANYCGKVAAGSTTTKIVIDKRTPVDLSMMKTPKLVLDNNRGVPTEVAITSWNKREIVLATPLSKIPVDFTSFAVYDADKDGLKPTFIRVVSVTDTTGGLTVEGVEYNHSLYDHVDYGLPLIVPKGRYTPTTTSVEITGLVLNRLPTGLTANWDALTTPWEYSWYWKRFGPDDGDGGRTIRSGKSAANKSTDRYDAPADDPLQPVRYGFFVTAEDGTGGVTQRRGEYIDLSLESGTSTVAPIPKIGIKQADESIGGTFDGRDFTVKWEHQEDPKVTQYILIVAQGGKNIRRTITDTKLRESVFTEVELLKVFGDDYGRQFTLNIFAVDNELKTTPTKIAQVENPAPQMPVVKVEKTGNIKLEVATGSIPTDVVGSKLFLWKGNDPTITDPTPLDPTIVETSDVAFVTIPSEAIVFDGSTYSYRVAWFDTFGKIGLNYGTATFVANPDTNVPQAPELTEVTPIRDTKVKVGFTHDGTRL